MDINMQASLLLCAHTVCLYNPESKADIIREFCPYFLHGQRAAWVHGFFGRKDSPYIDLREYALGNKCRQLADNVGISDRLIPHYGRENH